MRRVGADNKRRAMRRDVLQTVNAQPVEVLAEEEEKNLWDAIDKLIADFGVGPGGRQLGETQLA